MLLQWWCLAVTSLLRSAIPGLLSLKRWLLLLTIARRAWTRAGTAAQV